MSIEPLLSNARVLMSALISISFQRFPQPFCLTAYEYGFVQK